MHRVYLSLALALAALTAAPTLAQPNPSVSTAPALYKHAVKNLDDGHWFESAIADLTQAVKLDPDNSDYHLALGCAEVDRAGSIAYAAWMRSYYQDAQAQYPKDLAAWQKAQQDPKADDYGKPRPVAPKAGLHFPTKDDAQPLRLTKTQADARVLALEKAAQAEWRLAVSLAKTPPARAASVQGWGLQYERKMQNDLRGSLRKTPGVPEPMDVVHAFQIATKDAPGNAADWEGLGDAYPYSEFTDRTYAPEIIHAWQKALALAPQNATLKARLYRVEARTMPQEAQRLAASAPDSSFLQYSLAASLFKQTHDSDVYDTPIPDADTLTKAQRAQRQEEIVQSVAARDDAASRQAAAEALAAVERGNRGTAYAVPADTPPVPRILWHAWDYWHTLEQLSTFGPDFGHLRELARAVDGEAVVAAKQGHEAEVARAARAGIGLGRKLLGTWPVRDKAPLDGSVTQALVGIAIVELGYSALERVYAETGNTAQAQATATESDAFQQKKKSYLVMRSQTPA